VGLEIYSRQSDERALSYKRVEWQQQTRPNAVLAPSLQKLVAATQEAFVQAVLDLRVPKIAFGRVALTSNTAASTAIEQFEFNRSLTTSGD